MTSPAHAVPDAQIQEAIDLRNRLHQEPRPSGDEAATRDALATWLEARGIKTHRIGDTGLLAHRPGDGPPVLCRAELDALPLHEATGVSHASRRPGVHHACGHDGHMAMLATALVTAPAGADITAFFQPAEETGHGMQDCLATGLLDRPWHRVWSIHNMPGHPLGAVLVRPGTMALASTGLAVDFEGATSHAAEPENARNAAFAIAEVIPQLAPPPDDPHARIAVVGMQAGGPRFGTTAGDGTLWLTIRAATDATLDAMQSTIHDLVTAAANSHGVTVTMRRQEPFPATINHPDAVADIAEAASIAGVELVEMPQPVAWSEDFGYATARWLGALIGLGSGEQTPSLHAPTYDFPDALLPAGIRLWHALMGARP